MMTSIRRPKSTALIAALLLTGTLAACSRDEPERPASNMVEDTDEVTSPSPVPSPDRAALPAPDAAIQSNAIGELTDEPAAASEEPPTPDQQMLDDAAASGMTARASREPDTRQDTAVPVEQK